ncbi:DUF2069 domain-containing protein [Xanthomonas sp. MUS 060]|uniref:DUF2069 domain-containing protein n=1 Tax=Xanthomonas sp. MUS 060 TaxID=1588031 RepID=UPI0005F2930F|nr:DUF2069 domain-containing protein [Xanthomonas sp. MUS 060]
MSTLRLHLALSAALLALATLFVVWFHDDRQRVAACVVFVLPPLLLLIGVLRGKALARFWSGVAALLWFSHGVMTAWSQPTQRSFGWIELSLALLVVGLSSAPGIRARLTHKRAATAQRDKGT